MTIALTHAKSATAAAARAAARDTSSDDAASDEALIKRIAGGDQLAMRTFLHAIAYHYTAGCCALCETRRSRKIS